MFIYEDEALKAIPYLRHGFFGRTGGVSTGIYSSLNTGAGSKDTPEHVAHNRGLVQNRLEAGRLITCYQIHSADIVNIGENIPDPLPQADGMVTQHKRTALGILTADCIPILAADKETPVIGAAHAGWGGAFKGIASHLIKRMIANGAREENIVVALGPSIRQNSYEVDAGFRTRFLEQRSENALYFAEASRAGHFMFDLPAYALHEMTRAFPRLASVSLAPHDTYSDEKRFFSYRRSTHRQESDYGRQISAISID